MEIAGILLSSALISDAEILAHSGDYPVLYDRVIAEML
jgi:hypothetical protein